MVYKKYIEDSAEYHVMIAPRLQESCRAVPSLDPDLPDITDKVLTELKNLKLEIVSILARDQFFRFIQSKHYKRWRAAESSHAIAHNNRGCFGDDFEVLSGRGSISMRGVAHSAPARNSVSIRGGANDSLSSHNAFTINALTSVDVNALDAILQAKTWLTCLLAAVEAVPVCFSLSDAYRDRQNLPFVYVNCYFEKVSGFASSEILGKGYSFLVSPNTDKTNKEKLKDLHAAIQNGHKYSVLMNTRRADNIERCSLLSVKPIFDERKKLVYVVTVYYEIPTTMDSAACQQKTELAADLLDMLPGQIFLEAGDMVRSDACSSCLSSVSITTHGAVIAT
ncbi:unnamed protein product [Sphagnum balticum]